jgi:hypothetical protein
MDIQLTDSEKKELSEIYENKTFQKFIDYIISEKKQIIVDVADSIEMLNKCRFSLDGNKEILDELRKIHLEYEKSIEKPEKVDPYSVI